MTYLRLAVLAAVLVAIAGCAQNSTLAPSTSSEARSTGATRVVSTGKERAVPNGSSQVIQHVVIIVQENRSTNNLFNNLAGAGTTREGLNSYGDEVQLKPVLLTAPYDVTHAHIGYETEYANGQMNGFNLVSSICTPQETCPPKDIRAYGYVPENEVEPYYAMARRYAFGSNMFQTNQGPSFPAHQYLLSGTSTISQGSTLRASENPITPAETFTGGCDSPQGSLVALIDPQGQESQSTYPCFDRNSLIQLIEARGLTWHYYQSKLGPGLWNGPDAILPVFGSPEFATDVVAPSSQVLTDIESGQLANVVWVTPTAAESDHARVTDGTGPAWVASVVNTIGHSPYWKNTAIFVLWDDWGGWYDPAVPHQYNSYELGFRVPLLVISAYAKQHYISTKQHEFGSILKFTEKVFGLPSLGTTDVRSDDLADCFDFSKGPTKFVRIPASPGPEYFLKQPISNQVPDDDF
jgi:phospholipase C